MSYIKSDHFPTFNKPFKKVYFSSLFDIGSCLVYTGFNLIIHGMQPRITEMI